MQVRDWYDGKAKERSDACALECKDESLTVQSQKDDADINVLLKRFGITGVLPQNVRPPVYADFDAIIDYKSAMDAISAARDSFMAMPADVRDRFKNDPQEFVEFCSNPANLEEMRKLGLAVPAPEPAEPAPEPTPPA